MNYKDLIYAFNEGVKDAIADKFESFKTGLNKQEREEKEKIEKSASANFDRIFEIERELAEKVDADQNKLHKEKEKLEKANNDTLDRRIYFDRKMRERKDKINKGINIGTTAVVGGIGIYKTVKDAKLYKIYKEYLKNHPDEKLSFRDWKRLMKIKKKMNK